MRTPIYFFLESGYQVLARWDYDKRTWIARGPVDFPKDSYAVLGEPEYDEAGAADAVFAWCKREGETLVSEDGYRRIVTTEEVSVSRRVHIGGSVSNSVIITGENVFVNNINGNIGELINIGTITGGFTLN